MASKRETPTIRLNKYIANSGMCSRREADMHISLGTVKVNGKVVTEMGYQVKTGDEVRFDGQRINSDKPTYVLLNKPKGFLASLKLGNYKKDVLELVSLAAPFRIDPVHAMDRPSTGLLLFTNDQIMLDKLRANKTRIRKIYQVILDKNITSKDIEKIKAGVVVNKDLKIEVEDISFVSGEPKRVVGIEIHSQLYKAIPMLFEALDYKVEQLDLMTYAHLNKRDLPRGRWRHLNAQEVNLLKMLK